MKSLTRLFAEATACLEDMHGVAMEGQSPHQCPDLHRALLASLNVGLERVRKIASVIEGRLDGGR